MIFQFHFCGQDERYSYVVGSSDANQALIIDPVEACIDQYDALLGRLGYALACTLETGAVPKTEIAAAYLGGRWRAGRVVPAGADRSGTSLRVEQGDALQIAGLDIGVIAGDVKDPEAVSYRIGDRVFVGAMQVRDEPALQALPSDLLVYRSHRVRGTHFGLLGLEAGPASIDRDRWAARTGGRRSSGTGRRASPRAADMNHPMRRDLEV